MAQSEKDHAKAIKQLNDKNNNMQTQFENAKL